MTRATRLCRVLLVLVAVTVQPALAAGPSVVSINLCTDQLLVALADREQILGLSPYARDRLRSGVAAEAETLPVLSGSAEEVLQLRPDLVLAGRFTKRATRELLRQYGVRVVESEPARNLEEADAQLRQIGALLGHPERGEAAVAAIDAAAARARSVVGGRRPSALPVQRRGWVAGGGTLLASLLDAVGFANAGARFSRGFGRFVSLEDLVALRPDLLVVSETGRSAEDQGAALLQHPALAALYPPEKRLFLSDALNISCGGPILARALDELSAAAQRLR